MPASWVVQYWDASQWTNVTKTGSYSEADNIFNQVTFNPVTTTKLRVSMVAARTAGGFGAIQWAVPSIPS